MTKLTIEQHHQLDLVNSQLNTGPKGLAAIFASMGTLGKLLQQGTDYLNSEMKNEREVGITASNAIKHGAFKPDGALNEGLILEGLKIMTELSKSAVKSFKNILTAEKDAIAAGKHDKTEKIDPKEPQKA